MEAIVTTEQKYRKENYEQLTLEVKKGKSEPIKNHAQTLGETLNGFVNRAIDETIARDNEKIATHIDKKAMLDNILLAIDAAKHEDMPPIERLQFRQDWTA